MQLQTIENYITNVNFVLLILTMLFYLLQSASLVSFKWSIFPNSGIQLSNFLQATFLGLRWFLSGHFPLSNLYESLLFLAWVLTTLLILFINKIQTLQTLSINELRLSPNLSETDKLWQENSLSVMTETPFASKIKESSTNQPLINSFLGSLLTPLILLINTFATLSLPPELKITATLVPALKSNWLMMHVTFMVLSYGALLAGCLFSIAFLIISSYSTQNKSLVLENPQFRETESVSLENNDSNQRFFSDALSKKYGDLIETLDNLSYRIIGFGFPLLTIGILSGAVWANQTWGSYWSWDPKETWALITWIIFAIYLHTRLSHGWNGRQSALIASFGFIIIWVCYLGVNLLGKGLHSYGFFN